MQLNLSRQTGNIKLTELDSWQPTFPELCRAFSTPKIDNDKLNAGYILRGAGTKRDNDNLDITPFLNSLKTKNPRDITIGAGSETDVKLTPIESFRHSQFANSIEQTI
jgi:hypothetical protein